MDSYDRTVQNCNATHPYRRFLQLNQAIIALSRAMHVFHIFPARQ
ncbi:hypothetical protein ANO14919_120060 [Xylariales sp. No.14919]|nr:hypothetical protein ANO14919_120060 [Xylariales sp. No.14919]